MGRLVRDGAIPYGETPDSYLRSMFNRLDGSQTVLDSAFVGKTWYAALQIRADRSEFVTAIIVLTCGAARRGFGYKPMDESMGPHEADCPDRIMLLLSPIEALPGDPGYAAKWRAGVAARKIGRKRERAVMALPAGTHIRFSEPIRFSGGESHREFVVLARRTGQRGVRVYAVVGGEVCERVVYRISVGMLADAEVCCG